jgi:hypothetical protein
MMNRTSWLLYRKVRWPAPWNFVYVDGGATVLVDIVGGMDIKPMSTISGHRTSLAVGSSCELHDTLQLRIDEGFTTE